jgi:hypothetical protein
LTSSPAPRTDAWDRDLTEYISSVGNELTGGIRIGKVECLPDEIRITLQHGDSGTCRRFTVMPGAARGLVRHMITREASGLILEVEKASKRA